MAATRRSAALALDTYDPFGASSSSFLPPMGLFSPVAPSPASSRPTPGFCATIFEEEDQEESNDASSSISTITPDQRRPSAFSIHPRILRSDSCSDDDSDIPPAIVQDLDEYLETLEMYFPSELWEEQPHELRRKPNSAAVKSRLPATHRKRPSAESSSSSSCSRSSSYENLQHRRKSSFDDAVVDVQKLLKNSASSGNMKLASYTSTSSTSVRVSSPLSPPAEIRSHSRSGSDSPTSTAYSSSPSNSSSNSTVTPGSRTPSPTFAKHATALSPPKSILKPSKSSPLLRDRSTSVSSTTSSVSPPPVPRSSSRSSSNYNSPMSPTRGRAPVPMQLFAR
ncbi:hypothetical protein M407DRAFT_233425 [Tulasnella calospora MUT 4182]|uniref:Uncharacterized protein n=1 Tax=Tulasnella calospora MUT 4182 TaxID=1051891 RepID=A0A0C3QKX3_9AGAM|nr:hypothetical protein M407DRAFT_233425 [Tulasnella calospora MUT 4182]